jgi:hypothetical protein
MSPKKSKTAKSSIKKTGTMEATAAAGNEFLKRTWGEDQINKANALSNANTEQETKTKPKLSKTRTMQNTTKEAKALLGKEVLADTRAETKRRQAAANAKKAPAKVTKRKPALKRLGTMAKTAKEGKAYVKRTTKKSTASKPKSGGKKKASTK